MDMSWESLVWPLLAGGIANKEPLARAANGVLCALIETASATIPSLPPHPRSRLRSVAPQASRLSLSFAAVAVAALTELLALSISVLIPSNSSTSKPLHSNETSTVKQRDLSVSGYKLLCSSRNLAMLTEVVSAPLEVSKAIDRQYQWYVIALTGHRAI